MNTGVTFAPCENGGVGQAIVPKHLLKILMSGGVPESISR